MHLQTNNLQKAILALAIVAISTFLVIEISTKGLANSRWFFPIITIFGIFFFISKGYSISLSNLIHIPKKIIKKHPLKNLILYIPIVFLFLMYHLN